MLDILGELVGLIITFMVALILGLELGKTTGRIELASGGVTCSLVEQSNKAMNWEYKRKVKE